MRENYLDAHLNDILLISPSPTNHDYDPLDNSSGMRRQQ